VRATVAKLDSLDLNDHSGHTTKSEAFFFAEYGTSASAKGYPTASSITGRW
jgi:hypothetical protein